MSSLITLAADGLVAILLAATIVTSVRLGRRIAMLKADDEAMRRTVGELVLATENAERAIAGLRTTLGECDRTLAERLRMAERYAADLSAQVEAGNQVVGRIAQIVTSSKAVVSLAAKPVEPAERPPSPHRNRLSAAAAAANALAERAGRRLDGAAA